MANLWKEGCGVEEKKASCDRPVAVVAAPESPEPKDREIPKKEASGMTIMVGRKAPDFTAPVYRQGKFGTVSLGESLGKWTVVCFYPGDFTFV